MHLEIRLLGPFETLIDDKTITGFESTKVRGLLAYLAAEAGRPHRRDYLAGLFWPDWPQKSAMSNLRYALSDLRKNIGDRIAKPPFLDISRESIKLSTESDCWIDVVRFEQALSKGSLSEAVELYRDGFLDGFSLSDSSEFEDWLRSKAEYYRQKVLHALNELAEKLINSGEYDQALIYSRRALKIEPLYELAHQQVMRILALQGNRIEALSKYEKLTNMLKDEMGVLPSEATQHLYEQIRNGQILSLELDKEADSNNSRFEKQSHNLPSHLTSFIGRENEIENVRESLSKHRLVTLTGPGGVGKTRLAIQVGTTLLDSFPGGVWFVELASLVDPAIIPSAVARVLGLYEDITRHVIEQIQDFMKRKKILLILDNCEHLLNGCIQLVDTLLRSCPNLTILATSRETLGISGEQIYRLFSLSFPDPDQLLDVERILEWDAVRLLFERAKLAQSEFQINENNVAAVIGICQRLDGIPLAIELATARLKVLSVEQVAERLWDTFRLLTGGSRTALPRQQTLRATIDWSYNLLCEPEKILFRRLAVFLNGWRLEAAENICCENGLERDEILDLLGELASKSVVIPVHQAKNGVRYILPETVRQYAREKLLESGESELIRERHLDYFTRYAYKCCEMIRSREMKTWLNRLFTDLDNFRAVIEWSLRDEGDVCSGLNIVNEIGLSIAIRGFMIEALKWLQTAKKHPKYHESVPELLKLRTDFHHATHFTLEWVNRGQIIDTLLEIHSRANYIEPKPYFFLISIKTIIAQYYIYENNYEKSKQFLTDLLDLYTENQKQHPVMGIAFMVITNFGIYTKDYDLAYDNARSCLELYKNCYGDGYKSPLHILGLVETLQGNLKCAKNHFEQSLDFAREVGDLKTTALDLNFLSQWSTIVGNYREAVQYAQEAIEVAESYGNHMDTAWGLWCLAKARLIEGREISQLGCSDFFTEAAILLGAIANLERKYGWRTYADLMPDRLPNKSDSSSWIDSSSLEASYAQGQELSFDDIVEFALSISTEK